MSEPAYEIFQQRLRMLKIKKGEFAALVGVHPNTIATWRWRGVPTYANVIVELLHRVKNAG